MFEIVMNVLDGAKSLNESEVWEFALDKEAQEEIIRLNTQEQLYDKGVNEQGKDLGEYSEFTKEIKRMKGQPIDRVTLKDTGAFYESFKIKVFKNTLHIYADDTSIYDRPLSDVYPNILGLTDENKGWLSEFLKDKYWQYVNGKLLQ